MFALSIGARIPTRTYNESFSWVYMTPTCSMQGSDDPDCDLTSARNRFGRMLQKTLRLTAKLATRAQCRISHNPLFDKPQAKKADVSDHRFPRTPHFEIDLHYGVVIFSLPSLLQFPDRPARLLCEQPRVISRRR